MPILGVSQLDAKKIGAIACLTLALLIAGNGAYSYWRVDRPVAALLKSQPAIQSFAITRLPGRAPVVTLVAARDADLVQVHEALGSELESRLGPHQLKIVDTRSPQLTAFLTQAQFALYEAATNGNFVAMQATVAELAVAAGIEAQVAIRPQWIYLRAATADAYLLEAIARTGAAAGTTGGTGQ